MKKPRPLHDSSRVLFVLLLAGLLSCVTTRPETRLAEREHYLYKSAPSAEHAATTTIEEAIDEEAELSEKEILDAYLQIAIQNNGSLRSAFDRWVAAMQRLPQVTALADPQFTWTHFVEEPQTRTGPQENSFSLTQRFPWFGKLELQGEMAAQEAGRLWWNVIAMRLRVVREVKDAYFEYAYLGRAIQIVRENLELLKSLEPIVQRSIQVGAGQGDLVRLQVEIGKLENELASLEDYRRPISARLRSVLNLEGNEPLPWPVLLEADTRDFPLDSLQSALDARNPELKAIAQDVERATTLAKRNALDRYPDITLGLGFIDTDDAGPLPMPPDSAEPERFPRGSGDDPWSVSVGFNVPIWRTKYRAAVREAHALRASHEQELVQRRFDLLSQLQLRLYELNDATRQIELYQQTLIPRAQQALQVIEISYESGNATFLEVIDAQREVLALEKGYWRFVADYHQRTAELEMLCGGPLP